jgi:hypothetical protein
MRRILVVAAFLVCCVVAPAQPPALSAPGDISVLSSTVEAVFPSSLVFHLQVEAPVPVEDIRLHYQVERMKYVPTTSEAWPSFVASERVTTSWVWDMRRASLPPGALLTYWWTVRDANGSTAETIPASIVFDDDRYDWRELESADLTLHWYGGDDEFADTLMNTCLDAIQALEADIGAHVERHIEVYIYDSSDDLRSAMVYPQEWTGGVAFTEYGIIAIGIGPSDLDWGLRALRHELTHLVVHAATFSPFGELPTWLDEGLAMHNEGEPAGTFVSIFNGAVKNDSLLSLRTLSGPFSADPAKAYLSYAESLNVVEYLFAEGGSSKMNELLMRFKSGSTIDDALRATYGVDLDALEADWRASARQEVASA